MKLPTFTALNCLHKANKPYKASKNNPKDNKIILQDCGWLKNAGCTLGPFSWCALSGLGGAVAYWNCVDKASGGDCIECLSGSDPRDNLDRTTDGYGGVDEKGKFVGYGSQGLTNSNEDINSQLSDINNRLKKIEKCACPQAVLTHLPFDYLQYISHAWQPMTPNQY